MQKSKGKGWKIMIWAIWVGSIPADSFMTKLICNIKLYIYNYTYNYGSRMAQLRAPMLRFDSP